MSLKDLQTRIITAPIGSGFSATGFIVASLRTWQWQTQSPCTPVQLGSAALSVGIDANIFVVGKKAYITSGKVDSTISIFNITNALSPSLLGSAAFPQGTNPVVQNQPSQLTVLGNTLFYLDALPGGLITVVDVTTPASPALITQANSVLAPLTYIQGRGSLIYVQGTTSFGIYNSSLVLQGSLSFAPSGTGLLLNFPLAYTLWFSAGTSTLRVIDVSVPASPSVVATIPVAGPSTGSNRQSVFSLDGTTLYVSSTANNAGDQQMFVYDVSSTTPVLLRSFPLSAHVASFFVAGGCINSTDNSGSVTNINIFSAQNGGLIGSALVVGSNTSSANIVQATI